MADLLGGKGANLAEMTRLGLPVPPGFTITTEACRSYLSTGREPATLREEIGDHLAALERRMGRRLGRGADPLLVSVRSGARFSMPGMMETVLDVGLSDTSVRALAGQAGDDRFAWDSYRRLIQMFGRTVLGIDGSHFDAELEAARREEGVEADASLPAVRLRALVEEFKRITRVHGGRDFPQDPREQLTLAVDAVFDSWNTDRARRYRRQEHIPDDLGTAVSVCAMVFGNLGPDSGTGVAFTRDPATGRTGVYGDYLRNAQGEDVVAGYRNTVPLAELERIDPGSHRRLTEIMATLERHYLDLCDIEFTIERGTLWMLQTRVGKRTAAAAFRIAADLAEQEVIDDDEALRRVDGSQLAQLMFPHFDPAHRGEPVARGVPASPGAAVGAAVFDSARAAARAARGERVVLVRRETNPDDLDGMLAAEGVLTSRGGKTSHAAVVARGMGRTCVCGAEGIVVDADARRATVPGGGVIEEGDVLSVDGTDGSVHLGEVPVVPSTVVEYFENGGTPTGADPTTGEDPDDGRDDALVRAVDRLMRHADRRRVLGVRANADTGRDARRAARFGAAGVGLCRTEHMFLGERRRLVERLVLAVTDREREEVLAELLPLQRADFTELLAAMDGMPVTVRLLDPPLHEFLPDITELSVRVARAGDEGDDSRDHRLLRAVRRLHEQNPMLGLRGVRLGLVVPGLFAMQVRAVAEAAADRRAAGGDPRPEIMVPLVAAARELEIVREEAERVLAEVAARRGSVPTVPVGTMIELPRAALTAGEIAGAADFFSFGTNDLTQTVWGFSRDDVEGSFFAGYLERGVFPVSPFETIDAAGVGTLVRTAARTGRATSPDLGLGVCGEHGGDPASVRFFHEAGLDYVSCSPFRVPVARLEAGRAAVGGR
ncbi:pyruvate, phosphate dikinase [Streptomyces sp. ventii]|uniref:Pyruvate, phosphate dikinase n=2 Tax=Streptomyces spiramenti TaxID=2720606 RepID=A0ABX1AMJ8_9ACTN|nr:pyruvate, phosphate dikinase [Streptomyces spiramenti]